MTVINKMGTTACSPSLCRGRVANQRKVLYMRLFREAWRAALLFDVDQAESLANEMKKYCNTKFHEGCLIDAVIRIARNGPGDSNRAMVELNMIQNALERKVGNGAAGLCCREKRHSLRFHAAVLYAKATCLYYAERDRLSIRFFRKCLVAMKKCGMRRIFGMVEFSGVRRKVDSLVFRLSANGYVKARRLVAEGRFGEAARLLGSAIAKIGIDLFDHDEVMLAAKAYLATGDGRKWRMMVATAYKDAPNCMEARFLHVLASFRDGNACVSKGAVEVARSLMDEDWEGSCCLTLAKKRRIRLVVCDLMADRHWRFCSFGRIDLMKCIRFADYATLRAPALPLWHKRVSGQMEMSDSREIHGRNASCHSS